MCFSLGNSFPTCQPEGQAIGVARPLWEIGYRSEPGLQQQDPQFAIGQCPCRTAICVCLACVRLRHREHLNGDLVGVEPLVLCSAVMRPARE